MGALPSLLKSDVSRVIAACLFCAALFASDLFSTVEMNESQLYPLALLVVYGVRIRYVQQIGCALAILLTLLGYTLDPPTDVWDGVTNRAFSIIVLLGTAICLTKLSQYERRLLIQSMTDPLTGLLNRRSFLDLSGKEVTRAHRHGSPFSVLMLDIDHFKKINDSHGHPVGDLAIKALAAVCGKALRPHDILARYGGEEFVLTLPQTPADGARIVAERIREAVELLMVPSDSGPVRFTVSIAVVVERADQALYVSKQSGRNRVTVAGAEPVALSA